MSVTWVTATVGSAYDSYNQFVGNRGYGVKFYKCGDCGAHVTGPDSQQHENFHKIFSNRRNADMSKVLWCDRGDHAFKAGSPGSSTFEGTMVDDNGVTQRVTEDVCAEHNPFNIKGVARAAIEAELKREYPMPSVGGFED